MVKILAMLLVAAGSVTLLVGCWESSEVNMHKPGAYMGKADPLLDEDAGSRSAQLKERFQTVQIDR